MNGDAEFVSFPLKGLMENLSLVLKTLQRTGIEPDEYPLPNWSIPVVKSVMSCRVLCVHHCVLKPSGSGAAPQDSSKNPTLLLCRLCLGWSQANDCFVPPPWPQAGETEVVAHQQLCSQFPLPTLLSSTGTALLLPL